MLLYHGEKLTGLPIAEVSPGKGRRDPRLPRPPHLRRKRRSPSLPPHPTIFAAALGPKQFWEVPGAFHTAAIGFQPAEFQRRVLEFFANVAQSKPVQ